MTIATPDIFEIKDTDINNFFEEEKLWNIILWDSNLTTFEEVITGCMDILGWTRKRGQATADRVHLTGKALVATRPKDEASNIVGQFRKYNVRASMEQE